jgi:hypothetical protein
LFRKSAAFKGGEGVVESEELSVGGGVLSRYKVTSFAHTGRARLQIMGVGTEEVYPAVCKELMRYALGSFTHATKDGTGGDLDEHAIADPVSEAVKIALEGRIALGMGEDRNHACESEFVESLGEVRRKAEVWELDQKVFGVIECVFVG